MNALKLSEIWIYPIKSLGGIRLSSSPVVEKGLPYDRRWMLVDERGTFMTQRINPLMALFKLTMNKHDLVVNFKNDSLTIPLRPLLITRPERVTIWDDQVEAHEVDPIFSKWFSEHLDLACRLVHFPENNPRPVDVKYQRSNEQVSLADAYPFLIIGQSSLDDLNSKLEHPVPMNRFRPNFVFTGGTPYEEDTWQTFSIGGGHFAGVKTCSRCVLTTVNQDTAARGTEPLKTLASYRTWNSKVHFGQNLLSIDHHEVHEGDIITVNTYKGVQKDKAVIHPQP
jgi:uncharacterized protein YcbX